MGGKEKGGELDSVGSGLGGGGGVPDGVLLDVAVVVEQGLDLRSLGSLSSLKVVHFLVVLFFLRRQLEGVEQMTTKCKVKSASLRTGLMKTNMTLERASSAS